LPDLLFDRARSFVFDPMINPRLLPIVTRRAVLAEEASTSTNTSQP